jgi:hypothetical protein
MPIAYLRLGVVNKRTYAEDGESPGEQRHPGHAVAVNFTHDVVLHVVLHEVVHVLLHALCRETQREGTP